MSWFRKKEMNEQDLNNEEISEDTNEINVEDKRRFNDKGDVINDKTQKFLRDSKKVCLSKPFLLIEFRTAIGKALAV